VFGISMSSTVSGNSGFSMRVGNTTMKEPEKEQIDPRDVKPYAGGAPNIVPVYALVQPPKRIGAHRHMRRRIFSLRGRGTRRQQSQRHDKCGNFH
jgi:hypothetical protein